jgi:hypothetical protein
LRRIKDDMLMRMMDVKMVIKARRDTSRELMTCYNKLVSSKDIKTSSNCWISVRINTN